MKLKVNLRHIEKKDVRLEGEITASELELEDVDELVQLANPLKYDFVVELLSTSVYVHGNVKFTFECECSRCLKTYHMPVSADWSWDLPLEGEEAVAVENDCVDLTPILREDILLAFPQHPLCKVECSGLPKAPQKKSQQKSGASEASEVSSAWAELNKLKFNR
jgi:uncharacterized protein